MQATHQFRISTIALQAFEEGDTDRQQSLLHVLESHTEDIASLLTSYHWHEKASVQTIKIVESSVEIDANCGGRFSVKYGTNIHYGCSDIDFDLDNKMTINIRIDLQTGEAVLTGEYIPEREPDSF